MQVVQSPFLDVFAVSGGSGGPGHVRGVCSVLAPEQVVLGHQRAISNYLCGASDTLVCALRLGKLSQSELTKAALKYALESHVVYSSCIYSTVAFACFHAAHLSRARSLGRQCARGPTSSASCPSDSDTSARLSYATCPTLSFRAPAVFLC